MIVLAVVLTLLAVVGWVFSPVDFFHAWLMAFVFWTGIALGGLFLRLTHSLTSGRWGDTLRTQARAAGACLPWLLLAAVPLFFGLHDVFPWDRPEAVAADPVLQHQSGYMCAPWFIVRTIVYFLIWTGVDRWLSARSRAYEAGGDAHVLAAIQEAAGPLLFVVFVTSALASVDWLMALVPDWFSTQFPFLVISTQVLNGLALCTVVVAANPLITRKQLYDLGSMMLVFVMVMVYLSYGEWIIIWSGDLPHETIFYRQRLAHGWDLQAGLIVLLLWALPFTALIFGKFKEDRRALRGLSTWILFMGLVWLHWVIQPSYRPLWHLSWLDCIAPVALGCWMVLPYRMNYDGWQPARAYNIEEAINANA